MLQMVQMQFNGIYRFTPSASDPRFYDLALHFFPSRDLL